MKAEYINPFLDAAINVIEQVIQIRPTTGQLQIKEVQVFDQYVWIDIGMTGQMTGNIVFGLHESVALKMVSAMMGGFVLTELDEIGHSAISELGNMIGGNASTILYNQGVKVDITPPKVLQSTAGHFNAKQALSVPLMMEGIGDLDIQVLIS
ncbi:chemotaxis protein CheX [Paenibacillus selenitireducens]|jgi:chemotaxis protein CheX|uniref:Chemotaxis protein CheX n=1 Tax=Paenibacillus selenitireducens TaxID=1324314 RepID=A0A1T2XK77_9BACL|nr:chemotaxis protein CheX [Paenibacillus selenitireducens]OPA80083.1 chemotaxis protein CheX [Paenibacillus selenitireducens]